MCLPHMPDSVGFKQIRQYNICKIMEPEYLKQFINLRITRELGLLVHHFSKDTTHIPYINWCRILWPQEEFFELCTIMPLPKNAMPNKKKRQQYWSCTIMSGALDRSTHTPCIRSRSTELITSARTKVMKNMRVKSV